MNWIKGLTCIVTLAGIGVLLSGQLTHLGIVLLIEGGVLVTLLDENRRQGNPSRDPSV
jgi:hypothetical protein